VIGVAGRGATLENVYAEFMISGLMDFDALEYGKILISQLDLYQYLSTRVDI
jgi:hypothetical protein